MKNLINEIELYLEIKELRELGLSEEEIEGYFEHYIESWINERLIND